MPPAALRSKGRSKRQATGRAYATRSKTKAAARPAQPSPIERLPTELLQEIMILSCNFDMALTCRTLYSALTSNHVKGELVINTFSCSNVTWPDVDKSLNSDIMNELRLPKLKASPAGSKDAQSQLLGLKWLTSDFLVNCQKRFMQRNMRKILECFYRKCPLGEQMVGIGGLWDWVENLEPENCFLSEDSFNEFMCESPNEYRLERSPDNAESPTWLFKDHDDRICDFFLSQANACCFSHSVRRSWTLSMPRFSKDIHVPDCILTGPWTEERSQFLWHIHESIVRSAFLDDLVQGEDESDFELTNFSSDAASKGLLNALKERCLLAAVILAQPNQDPYLYKGYQAELDTYVRPFPIEQEIPQLSTRGFGVELGACHLAAAFEWDLASEDESSKIFPWLLHLAVAKDKKLVLREVGEWLCEGKVDKQHRLQVWEQLHYVSEDWNEFEMTWRYG